MTAHDVIESYVRDVAGHLPRGKRNDIAFELRVLLHDELAAKAQAAGRAPDRAMALDLLKGFGRPAEAAQRYHERPAVIDPADTHHFVIWSIAGAVILALRSALHPGERPTDVSFLGWLGALVIVFGLLGWWRRSTPGRLHWRPKASPDALPRALAALIAAALAFFPLFMYAAPQAFVRVAFAGAIPSGGLALTDAFRGSWQRAATLACLGALVAVYAVLAVRGRWQPALRWTMIAAHGALGTLFALHAAPLRAFALGAGAGDTFLVFESAAANAVAMPLFAAVGGLNVLSCLYEGYRERTRVRPAPALATG